MVVKRRKLGTGQGQGYLNIVPIDSYIHGLNAKGIETTGQLYAKGKKQVMMPKDNKGLVSVLKGKGFRKDFGTIPTAPKKSLIREIARKVTEGVDWAIEWEKMHLPKQKAWVKKEFEKAKELALKGEEFVKEEVQELKKGFKEGRAEMKGKKLDMDDVRDELDTDDDGQKDIPLEELKQVNKGIHEDLQTIDLDDSGVPDHLEEEPMVVDEQFVKKKEKKNITLPLPTPDPKKTFSGQEDLSDQKITLPLPSLTPQQEYAKKDKTGRLFDEPPVPVPKPSKTFKQKAGEFVKKEAVVVKEKVGGAVESGKRFIQKKQLERDILMHMPDNELRNKAITTPSVFRKNKFERELIRRTKKRVKVDNEIQMARKQAKTEIKQGKTTGFNFNKTFGFLNPFQSFQTKKER